MVPAYDKVTAGDKRRTADQGTFTADLSGASGLNYYDIMATSAVLDKDGYLNHLSHHLP